MVVATAVSTFGIFIVVALSGIHHHKPTSKVPKCVKCFITGVIGTRLCRMKFNKEQNLSKVNNHKLYFFSVCLFVYLGFYVAFNTVQVISRRVVGRAEETST